MTDSVTAVRADPRQSPLEPPSLTPSQPPRGASGRGSELDLSLPRSHRRIGYRPRRAPGARVIWEPVLLFVVGFVVAYGLGLIGLART